jgi:hypothetical protein
MTTYTAEYFIRKFEAIPEEKWCVRCLTDGASSCALGHCGATRPISLDVTRACRWDNDQANQLAKLFTAHRLNVELVNDGDDDCYPQPAPKARILAALTDILAREKKENQ